MADGQAPAPAASGFETRLTKVTNGFLPMIESQLQGNMVKFDEYARQCVINAIVAINTALDESGITWGHPQLNNSNMISILLNIAALRLNAAANPREVYFQIRNTAVDRYDEEARKKVKEWRKVVEMGIEGDGNDALLSRFGREVKTVHPYWVVREGDIFKYPKFKGLEMSPPLWEPKGKGRVERIVYPITRDDNTTQFHIAERADVLPNLLAHINNNLMNETFGVCQDRKDATRAQKQEITAKKTELIKKAEQMGLDAALDSAELAAFISPAWRAPQAREQMLIRKMRNNIVKKIPKDFGSVYVSDRFDQLDEGYRAMHEEISRNANSEAIDFDDMQEAVEIVHAIPSSMEAADYQEPEAEYVPEPEPMGDADSVVSQSDPGGQTKAQYDLGF